MSARVGRLAVVMLSCLSGCEGAIELSQGPQDADVGAELKRDHTAPTVPTGVTVTAQGCTALVVAWAPSTDSGGSGLAGYRVFRDGALIATVGTATTSFADAGLAASSGHAYSLAAFDRAGNTSARSAPVSASTPVCPDVTPPSVPTNLTATATSCSQVQLGFGPSTDSGGSGLAGYRIYRDGLFHDFATSTMAVDSALAGGTGYRYEVSAIDAAGNESAKTAAAFVMTPVCSTDTAPPSVPSGLTAHLSTCGAVELGWQQSTDTGGSGLAGYRVYRDGTTLVATLGVGVLMWGETFSAACGVTPPSYQVSAIDNVFNESVKSAAVTPVIPSAPAGVTATVQGCGTIALSWLAGSDRSGSGLKGYRVYRNGQLAVELGPTDLSTSDFNLASNTAYSYTVTSLDNSLNESAPSAAANATTLQCADTTPPSVPTLVTATAASCSQVSLSWGHSTDGLGPVVSGVQGYRVFRDGVQLATVNEPSVSFTDSGRSASTAYAYTVSAVDVAGNVSAASAPVTITTPSCTDTTAPSIPSGVTAAATSCSSATVSWSASTDTGGSGVKLYRVYRNGAFWADVLPPATTFVDDGLTSGGSFGWQVSAIDVAGNESGVTGGAAVIAPACTDSIAPAAPGAPTAVVGDCHTVTLSWSASTDTGGSGLRGYRITAAGVYLEVTGTSAKVGGLTYSTAYNFSIRAVDNAGNLSAAAGVSASTPLSCMNAAQLDTAICGHPAAVGADKTASSTATPTFLIGGDGGAASYELFLDGVSIGVFRGDGYAHVCVTAPVPLSDGPHRLTGNELAPHAGYTVVPFDFTVDTVPPPPPSAPVLVLFSDSGARDGITRYRNPTLSGTAGPLATVLLASTLGGGLGGALSDASGHWSAVPTSLADGIYPVAARTMDPAGNLSAPSAAFPLVVDGTAPAAPAGAAVTTPTCGTAIVTWGAASDSGSGVARYLVYRGTALVGQVSSPSLTFTDSGLTASTAYSYTVSALDVAANESARSSAVTVMTPACN